MTAPSIESSAASWRVILVDDQEVVRNELRLAFELDGRIAVAAEAVDGRGLLAQLQQVVCDAILLDLAMPGMSGLQVLGVLRERPVRPPVVVLSTYDDAGYVDRALRLGAAGYVLKSARVGEIVMAVESAIDGGAYLQPVLARAMVERHLLASEGSIPASTALSPRQMQVLQALCDGLTAKEVAERLGLAEGTIGVYIKQLYERLGVTSRAGAVAVGIRRGLIL